MGRHVWQQRSSVGGRYIGDLGAVNVHDFSPLERRAQPALVSHGNCRPCNIKTLRILSASPEHAESRAQQAQRETSYFLTGRYTWGRVTYTLACRSRLLHVESRRV